MLAKIRAFLTVLEEGSVRQAAARLRVSQPALSRQIQALEHELGGPLFERTSTGVRPTDGGHALASRMRLWIEGFDAEWVEARRLVRGDGGRLRIGYLHSAAKDYLQPALRRMRRDFPDTKQVLFDMTPGEQIAGLRAGELDLVLTDGAGAFLTREFYVRKLASLPVRVAMATGHPLAGRKRLKLSDLKNEVFVRGSEDMIPGAHRQLERICLKHGRFRPRTIGSVKGLEESMQLVGNDGAVTLLPSLMEPQIGPGVVLKPLANAGVEWDLMLVWRRGRTGEPLRALVDAFFATDEKPATPAKGRRRSLTSR